MNLSEKQQSEFEQLSKQLIKWLCENCHPHCLIIIEPTSAELLEGQISIANSEFVAD
jgi:hypothetical protein